MHQKSDNEKYNIVRNLMHKIIKATCERDDKYNLSGYTEFYKGIMSIQLKMILN